MEAQAGSLDKEVICRGSGDLLGAEREAHLSQNPLLPGGGSFAWPRCLPTAGKGNTVTLTRDLRHLHETQAGYTKEMSQKKY